MEVKTCPECGKTFECAHSADCWCSTIKLSDSARKLLSDKHNNCLCINCLKEFTNKNTDKV